jgi:hypothetical protein
MESLSLAEAFVKLGGKVGNRLHGRSAIAADGAMILSCSAGRYGHPAPGVLRYEDHLSRDPDHPAETAALGEHLALARDGELPIRMIVVTRNAADANGRTTQTIHIRNDLVGKVIKFDGDAFIVDFRRASQPVVAAQTVGRRRS